MTRFYQQEFPNVSDIVIVKITNLSETEVHVEIQGYEKPGYIQRKYLVSADRKTRRKPLSKLVSVGNIFPAQVLEFDSNGNITLSKLHVDSEDVEGAMTEWDREKWANSIMKQISIKADIELQELYNTLGWSMQNNLGVLRHFLQQSCMMTAFEGLHDLDIIDYPPCIENALRPVIHGILEKMFRKEKQVVFAEVEIVSVYGIDTLKQAVATALADTDIIIRSVSAPIYRMELGSYAPDETASDIESVISNLCKMDCLRVSVKTPPQISIAE